MASSTRASSRPPDRADLPSSASTNTLTVDPHQSRTSFDPSRLELTPDEWYVPVTVGPPEHVVPTKSFHVLTGCAIVIDYLRDAKDVVRSIYHGGELMGYIYSSHTMLKSGERAVNPYRGMAAGSADSLPRGDSRPAGMIIDIDLSEDVLGEDGTDYPSDGRLPHTKMNVQSEANRDDSDDGDEHGGSRRRRVTSDNAELGHDSAGHSDDSSTETTEIPDHDDAEPGASAPGFTDEQKLRLLAVVSTALLRLGGDSSHAHDADSDDGLEVCVTDIDEQ